MKGKLIQEKGITRVELEYGDSSYYFDIHPSINNKLVDLKRSSKAFTIGIKSSFFDEELSLDITIPQHLTFLSEKDFEGENEDSYFVMNENFEFYYEDGNLSAQELTLGTKVHKKEKKAIIPPTGIPTSTIVSTTTTSIPWRKILAGVGVILILVTALLYKRYSSTIQDNEHLLKFIAEYHNDTDFGNKQALLSKMQFPIASYYKLGELTEAEYSKILDKYYGDSIDSSKTTLDIAKIKSNSEVISHGDSTPGVMSDYVNIVNAEYPINYVFFKDGKGSEFDITLGVTLLEDKGGNLKIYEIKELERIEVIVSEPPPPVPPGDTTEGRPEPPEPISGGPTGDPEGEPQLFDCSALSLNFGDSCDDGNPDTEEDVVQRDCKCRGISSRSYFWYADIDYDGLGDPNSEESTTSNVAPQGGRWVRNADDQCPSRPGETDGCPVLKIKPVSQEIFVRQENELVADDSGLLQTDILSWSGHSSINFLSNNSRRVNIKCSTVGKHQVKYSVENTESPFAGIGSITLEVKISNNQLRDIIQPIVVQGSSNGPGNFEEKSLEAMENLFEHTLNKRIPVFDADQQELGPLETFLRTDIKGGLPRNKYDIEFLDIEYDSNTGKISELYINFL